MDDTRFTPVGLDFRGLDPQFEEWAELGITIGLMSRSSMWYLGDWRNYGDKRFGEAASQAFEVLGVAYQTAANAKWLSKAFPFDERVPELTWSHHAVVASLPSEARAYWLRLAAQNGWTVSQLKAALREEKTEDIPNFLDAFVRFVHALTERRTKAARREISVIRKSLDDFLGDREMELLGDIWSLMSEKLDTDYLEEVIGQ